MRTKINEKYSILISENYKVQYEEIDHPQCEEIVFWYDIYTTGKNLESIFYKMEELEKPVNSTAKFVRIKKYIVKLEENESLFYILPKELDDFMNDIYHDLVYNLDLIAYFDSLGETPSK